MDAAEFWPGGRLVLVLTLLCAGTVAIAADARAGTGQVVETDGTFKSRGHTIVVDVYSPAEPGQHPAVVVLHGHGGVGDNKRSGAHSLARLLAQSGYVGLVPHYFGRVKPDPKNAQKNTRSYAVWERTVSDTVGFAAKRPDVDPKRIGLLGLSLGSWVAISVGARDRRVAAVVEHFGGYPEWESLDPTRLPPVLILHGDADRVVPVQKAYLLEDILKEARVPYEMHIYAGADHGFRGADRDDSIKRTVEFFDKHVKGPSSGGAPKPDESSLPDGRKPKKDAGVENAPSTAQE